MFDAALRAHPAARSLDAETFFADPEAVAAAAAEHLGLRRPAEGEADPGLISTYSKDPSRHFDETERRARQAERRDALSDEIAMARRWIESAPAARVLPACLDRPLVGDAAPLLT